MQTCPGRAAMRPPPAARAVRLLALGGWCLAPGAAQLLPPGVDLLNNSVRNLTVACARLKYEALQSCLEYQQLGFTASSCTEFQRLAETNCYSTGGNCTAIAGALLDQCKFQLQTVVTNPIVRLTYCKDTATQYEQYRCPPASYSPLNATFCKSAEALDCMVQCGNYRACGCLVLKGTIMPDLCNGTTILKGPLPGVVDPYTHTSQSIGNYSCSTVGQPPAICRNHIKEGTCAKFKYCPADMCVIKNISCPNRTQCEAWGECEPTEGLCTWRNKPDGTPCNDGLFYTLQDQCHRGDCFGTTDYCLKYNTTCIPESTCLTGGTCNPASGRCVFEEKPDGTRCDDGRAYTLEDRCVGGLCMGKVVNLCMEWGITCLVPNSCYDPGVCDPLTGTCTDPVPAFDNRPCDDNDAYTVNETCVDGICLGDVPGISYDFLTLSGRGECADRDNRKMARYTGDLLGGREECEQVCRDDIQCAAYGYVYPICSIYGTVRTRPPQSSLRWAFELGTEPPAVAIEMTLPLALGQRQTVCRRKGYVKDTLDPDAQHHVNIDDWFGTLPLVIFSCAMLTCFLSWPILRCLAHCVCPRRVRNTEVEVVDSPKAAQSPSAKAIGDLRATAARTSETAMVPALPEARVSTPGSDNASSEGTGPLEDGGGSPRGAADGAGYESESPDGRKAR